MEKETMTEQELPETEETVSAEETPEQTQVLTEDETSQVAEEPEEDETEETEKEESEEVAEQAPAVVERPLWQRVGALIALVLFIALILMYYVNIARGGR